MPKYKGREVTILEELLSKMQDNVSVGHVAPNQGTETVPVKDIHFSKKERDALLAKAYKHLDDLKAQYAELDKKEAAKKMEEVKPVKATQPQVAPLTEPMFKAPVKKSF